MKHGTLSKYTNESCRCWRCKKANREYKREYRQRKRAGRVHTCPTCTCEPEAA